MTKLILEMEQILGVDHFDIDTLFKLREVLARMKELNSPPTQSEEAAAVEFSHAYSKDFYKQQSAFKVAIDSFLAGAAYERGKAQPVDLEGLRLKYVLAYNGDYQMRNAVEKQWQWITENILSAPQVAKPLSELAKDFHGCSDIAQILDLELSMVDGLRNGCLLVMFPLNDEGERDEEDRTQLYIYHDGTMSYNLDPNIPNCLQICQYLTSRGYRPDSITPKTETK